MSNRDLKDRKLQPYQRIIWRKAFEASMQHTSIEAAEKKAWQVVDIWERVGAFHESNEPAKSNVDTIRPEYKEAFGTIREWLNTMQSDVVLDGEKTERLWEVVRDFDVGTISPEQFRNALESIAPFGD